MSARRIFMSLAYALAGLASGWASYSVVSWTVWGRAPQQVEVAGLYGSVLLVGVAVVNLFRPRLAATLGLLGALPVVAFFVSAAIQYEQIRQADQELQVVFVRWTPGTEPVTLEPYRFAVDTSYSTLSGDEMSRLRTIGLTGRISIAGASKTGRGKTARMIVVADRQVTSPIDLPQPDGTEAIYIQRSDSWQMYPPQAPTIDRKVHLQATSHSDRQTWFFIDAVTAREGGTAFVW